MLQLNLDSTWQEEKLDVLINNAGVMNCKKSLTFDGIETQLETNHMGPFLLTNLLKPYLKESGTLYSDVNLKGFSYSLLTHTNSSKA